MPAACERAPEEVSWLVYPAGGLSPSPVVAAAFSGPAEEVRLHLVSAAKEAEEVRVRLVVVGVERALPAAGVEAVERLRMAGAGPGRLLQSPALQRARV